MIFYNETVAVPFSGFILQRTVNISVLAGNDNITLSLIDANGVQSDFDIPAGQKLQQRDFSLFRFTIQGSGLAAVALSYPEVIDPSIQASLNPSLPQSITTPQLPPALDSNDLLKINKVSSSQDSVPAQVVTNSVTSYTTSVDYTVPSGYKLYIEQITFLADIQDASTVDITENVTLYIQMLNHSGYKTLGSYSVSQGMSYTQTIKIALDMDILTSTAGSYQAGNSHWTNAAPTYADNSLISLNSPFYLLQNEAMHCYTQSSSDQILTRLTLKIRGILEPL